MRLTGEDNFSDMIPKILHYVWLGEKSLPADVLARIDRWHAVCPDYDIRQWGNAEAMSVAAHCQYLKEAIEAKAWAFASDVVRLWALKECGGIYLDTDIELVDSLDEFLDKEFFCSSEVFNGHESLVSTALLGSQKGGSVVRTFYDDYLSRPLFIDGVQDYTTNVDRLYSILCAKYPFLTQGAVAEPVEFAPGNCIYPAEYFCTGKFYARHLFEGSWSHERDWLLKWCIPIGMRYRLYRFKRLKATSEDPVIRDCKIVARLSLSRTRNYFFGKMMREGGVDG